MRSCTVFSLICARDIIYSLLEMRKDRNNRMIAMIFRYDIISRITRIKRNRMRTSEDDEDNDNDDDDDNDDRNHYREKLSLLEQSFDHAFA